MRLKHIDGEKLYYAFYYGKREVLKRRKHLNKINVFPVPDGDTGNNMVMTMQSILDGTKMKASVGEVSQGMAEAALTGSRGNSGIIFAQFIQGLSEAVRDKKMLDPREFAHAMRNGVEHAYRAMKKPVEGTILTVMKSWANALSHLHTNDFVELLHHSIKAARVSLKETKKKLKVLEKAGVVDAGAQGFVHFIEGMAQFLRHGKQPELREEVAQIIDEDFAHVHVSDEEIVFRYCTEAVIKGDNLDPQTIRDAASPYGDSLIVAGSGARVKLHIHTNRPAELFYDLRRFGSFSFPKMDDMKRQHAVQFKRKSNIALVTDSTCDLPQELIDSYQIHVVPVNVAFGESQFLDKATIIPEQFYAMLEEEKEFPKTSQPDVKAFENLYRYLLSHYKTIVSIHLSKALSGTWNAAHLAAKNVNRKKITVIDSKHLATSLGLMVLRLAQEIDKGRKHDDVVRLAESFPPRARDLVSVKTLKYLVRGGRVSPLKGVLAKALNLKPIISLTEEGIPELYGKAFSRRTNIRKILNMVETHHRKNPIIMYAMAHVRAEEAACDFGKKVEALLGFPPAYTINVSPAIGSHAGAGAVCVSFLSE
jgi:DAK2 domain fusion protein YloV